MQSKVLDGMSLEVHDRLFDGIRQEQQGQTRRANHLLPNQP
jgi:hypothetical protein